MGTATVKRQNYLNQQEEKLSEIEREILDVKVERETSLNTLCLLHNKLNELDQTKLEVERDIIKTKNIMQEKGEL